MSCIFVTGGAGFIGSNFVLDWLKHSSQNIVNLDLLTYAGNRENLKAAESNSKYKFIHDDIQNRALVEAIFKTYRPTAVVHFAAESHVDRSISGPAKFVGTNVIGTFTLLEATRQFWSTLDPESQLKFRFIHISTDEVFGSLLPDQPAASEQAKYLPNNPYAASKASADHFVRAYFQTYKIPTIITNCSNNYGPMQFPEKLIPLVLLRALAGSPIPIYGDGQQRRDWLFVEDHCEALRMILASGIPGETYNIGTGQDISNLDIVTKICDLLDTMLPNGNQPRRNLMQFVSDRPGHDRRYCIDSNRLKRELLWKPRHSLTEGLEKTVRWYLQNRRWVEQVQTGEYSSWIQDHYNQPTL